MEEKEYNEKLNEIEKEADSKKNQLYKEYAFSNAKFKVGDIIKDNRFIIKVDNITAYKFFGLPEAVYHGIELKKDLTPKKNRNRESIYGNGGELVNSK